MSIKEVSNFNRKSAEKWAVIGLPKINKTLKNLLNEFSTLSSDGQHRSSTKIESIKPSRGNRKKKKGRR